MERSETHVQSASVCAMSRTPQISGAILSFVCIAAIFIRADAYVGPITLGAFSTARQMPSIQIKTGSRRFVMQTMLSEVRPATPSPTIPTPKEPAVASADWRAEVPEPALESEVGADYIPLLTSLKLGRYEEADQLTRDLLVFIAGPAARKRGFVYFAEAPRLPSKDILTLDRLWLAYSQASRRRDPVLRNEDAVGSPKSALRSLPPRDPAEASVRAFVRGGGGGGTRSRAAIREDAPALRRPSSSGQRAHSDVPPRRRPHRNRRRR